MSVHVKTIRRDDLDGTEGAETYVFGVGDKMYQVDLSPVNAARFRQTMGGVERRLAKYIEVAREVDNRPAPRKTSRGSEIRTWAQEHGYEINHRGRIPDHVIEAFDAHFENA